MQSPAVGLMSSSPQVAALNSTTTTAPKERLESFISFRSETGQVRGENRKRTGKVDTSKMYNKLKMQQPAAPTEAATFQVPNEVASLNSQDVEDKERELPTGQSSPYQALFDSIPQSGLKCDILMVVARNRLLDLEEFVKRLRVVFQFNITKDGKLEATWTADTRVSLEGDIYRSSPKPGVKADCILTIDDDDFIKVMAGKLNPQRAFMLSKLKVKGNIMLLQKLYTVWYDIRRKGLAPELDLIQDIMVSEPLMPGLKSEMMAIEIIQRLVRVPHLMNTINMTIQVDVTQRGRLVTQYSIGIYSGKKPIFKRLYNAQTNFKDDNPPKPDVRFTIDDDDIVLIIYGIYKISSALECGKLKVEGQTEMLDRVKILFEHPPIISKL